MMGTHFFVLGIAVVPRTMVVVFVFIVVIPCRLLPRKVSLLVLQIGRCPRLWGIRLRGGIRAAIIIMIVIIMDRIKGRILRRRHVDEGDGSRGYDEKLAKAAILWIVGRGGIMNPWVLRWGRPDYNMWHRERIGRIDNRDSGESSRFQQWLQETDERDLRLDMK